MVGWGFGLLLTLVVLLAVVGLMRLASVMHVAEHLFTEQGSKVEYITRMQMATRQRFVGLYRMSLETDPFRRDQAYQAFLESGSQFLTAQNSLRSLDLSPAERSVLDRIHPMLIKNSEEQSLVAELLLQNRVADAESILRNKVIPDQDRVLDLLNQLITMQQSYTKNTLQATSERNSQVFGVMSGMAFVVVMFGLAISLFVYRRTSMIETRLFEEKERAQVTLHSISDAVITADNDFRINYMNPVAEAITGWKAQNAIGRNLRMVFNPLHEITHEPISSWFDGGLPDAQMVGLNQHALIVTPAGKECIVETGVAPLRNFQGDKTGLVLAFRDVTYARQLARDLAWAASHDPLTGLFNRREFELRLAESLRDARNNQNRHAMLYMDLDQFKVVNDTSGHMAGDELLKHLGSKLLSHTRLGDVFARLGGDEFGLLLKDVTLAQASEIAEHLREAVREFRFAWQERLFDVGVSIGVVPITQQTPSPANVMIAADAACYLAKDNGRNRIHVSEENDQDISFRREEMRWTQRIAHALEHNRFRLFYQKIVPVGNAHNETHCEILLRMMGDNGEIISPMSFIPACERYSLMPTVDRWVIRHALEWIGAHSQDDQIATYFINLSGQSFNDDTFMAFVVQSIRASSIDPKRLGFEITETAAIANLERALEFMRVLLEMGCRFSLDDFGAGMSSFAYLKRFKVDKIKIDGMFVRNMVADATDRAMVEAINRIGHVMGIQTVAEFVESKESLAMLAELGVDFAQGYSIHEPEPLERIYHV